MHHNPYNSQGAPSNLHTKTQSGPKGSRCHLCCFAFSALVPRRLFLAPWNERGRGAASDAKHRTPHMPSLVRAFWVHVITKFDGFFKLRSAALPANLVMNSLNEKTSASYKRSKALRASLSNFNSSNK